MKCRIIVALMIDRFSVFLSCHMHDVMTNVFAGRKHRSARYFILLIFCFSFKLYCFVFFYGGVTYKVSFKFFSDVALLWQSYRFILNSIGKQTFGFWVSFSFSFSQIIFYARFAALLAANSGMAKFTIFH